MMTLAGIPRHRLISIIDQLMVKHNSLISSRKLSVMTLKPLISMPDLDGFIKSQEVHLVPFWDLLSPIFLVLLEVL
jgi:hypothetical protein